MQHFAVIGSPIMHSLSPTIHEHFAKQFGLQLDYERIEGTEKHFEEQVVAFFAAHGKGMNCTLPFKQRAFAMAKNHTSRCQKAGAANTLWQEQGQLWADNTDGIGFLRDLARHDTLTNTKILIVGAGGAARGILGSLVETNPATLVLVNRTLKKAMDVQAEFPSLRCCDIEAIEESFDLIINATSASLSGPALLLPEALFVTKPFCYDLSYSLTAPTPFVAQAHKLGCPAVDGLGMLVEQAAEAFFIWHGLMPSTEPVLQYFKERARS